MMTITTHLLMDTIPMIKLLIHFFLLLYITSMDTENKIQKCSTCGDAFIAGMINGKQLKNCRTCRDKKNKRKALSETQETEKSQPPSDDEQSRFIPPTYEQSNNHYSNMPLCRPDFSIPTQENKSKYKTIVNKHTRIFIK